MNISLNVVHVYWAVTSHFPLWSKSKGLFKKSERRLLSRYIVHIWLVLDGENWWSGLFHQFLIKSSWFYYQQNECPRHLRYEIMEKIITSSVAKTTSNLASCFASPSCSCPKLNFEPLVWTAVQGTFNICCWMKIQRSGRCERGLILHIHCKYMT